MRHRAQQSKSITMLGRRTQSILHRIKDAALTVLTDAEIILYGSRARGMSHAESDWDILILTDAPVTFDLEETMRRQIDDLSLELNIVVSAFVHNRREWATPQAMASPYHEAVMREGIAV